MQTKSSTTLLTLAVFLISSGFTTAAQTRDHLTPQEVELVQESQVLDLRIEVFIKAIQRRLMVVNSNGTFTAKQLQKDSEKWGELPKGTRAELVGDIARILEEAITNIDDVSMHDEKNPLLAKSLRKLNVVAEQLMTELTPLGEQSKNADEISSISQTLENAASIIDAAKKLPAAVESEKSKSKNKKPKG